MYKIIITCFFIAANGIISCNSNHEVKVEEKSTVQASEDSKSDTVKEANLSVEEIDKLRSDIEALDIKPIEVATSNLREKVKQKWSKIHFYIKDNIVVRIKTYPHAGISKRTEEFYANENGLVLTVIEDNGEGAKGKPKSEIDKMYYFDGGKLIKEISKEKETEYTVKDSDAEELLSEFNEYLKIFNETKK